jgi:hypothetical protein
MKCYKCKYWNLSERNKEFKSWADCYRVIEKLQPELNECVSDLGFFFAVPFDPHDVDKFKFNSLFKKLYRHARSSLPKGMRVQKEKGNYYFQTHENYDCGCDSG